ncbi:MAG TPA: hypothetical protein VLE93_01960 [Candidatus Saccharimonadales bacterium]|nr:hypothetical protein [Candidatus Saccharimonadales bacterium]
MKVVPLIHGIGAGNNKDRIETIGNDVYVKAVYNALLALVKNGDQLEDGHVLGWQQDSTGVREATAFKNAFVNEAREQKAIAIHRHESHMPICRDHECLEKFGLNLECIEGPNSLEAIVEWADKFSNKEPGALLITDEVRRMTAICELRYFCGWSEIDATKFVLGLPRPDSCFKSLPYWQAAKQREIRKYIHSCKDNHLKPTLEGFSEYSIFDYRDHNLKTPIV